MSCSMKFDEEVIIYHGVIAILNYLYLHKHLQQRKLSWEAKDKAVTLLEMKANKKLIQQQLRMHVAISTGNIILLKDLSNIATAH